MVRQGVERALAPEAMRGETLRFRRDETDNKNNTCSEQRVKTLREYEHTEA
jgi:hypothetical protein